MHEPQNKPAALFTPFRLGGMELPNRFVRSATWDGLGAADGSFTKAQQELYAKLADGAIGLVTTGFIAVNRTGRRNPTQNLLENRTQQRSLRELAAVVHDRGAKLGAQLVHCGGVAGPGVSGGRRLAPSAVAHPLYSEGLPEAMNIKEIRETLAAFAAAAARAREAGCDLVQIHAAHGYLISQFLSPFSNHREDDYGGSPAGRARFLNECYRGIRQAVGDDFPITLKINGSDYLDGGLQAEASLAVVQELARLGLDGVEVSGGNPAAKPLTPIPTGIRPGENELPFRKELALFTKALALPVQAVGGIRSFATAVELRQQGVALIALCRPLIREPRLIARWQAGDLRPAACLSCNRCFIPGYKGEGVRCLQV